jgi:hypothetical protein
MTTHDLLDRVSSCQDGYHPFLAYSSKISIKDSSERFRALLGAILLVLKGAHIEPSTFNPDMQLDTFIEDIDEGPLLEDNDIDDNSGAYPGSSIKGGTSEPPTRHRSRARRDNAEPGLMVCPFAGSYLLHG